MVELPEFYVGSVIAVTVADRNAQTPDKTSRFVGICIARGGAGTRASNIERNVLDNQGVEFLYDLYAPTVLKVETLRLEKRLDDELYYLRDAPLEYSTFPFDMDAEMLPDGQPVPINEVRVPLNPAPWVRNWARYADRLMGYTCDYRTLYIAHKKNYETWTSYRSQGWMMQLLKYDLLLHYMETIPLEEQDEIWEEVADELIERDHAMKKVAAQRSFTRPVERK
jgi:large subunit ribosomal protein L19